MATLAARPYTNADAEKLEALVAQVETFRRKHKLTSLEMLIALRYSTPKFRWDEELNLARELCVAYDCYHDIRAEETEKLYGD